MYRIIDSKIWEDSWFFDLTAEQKLLFVYLITSSHTNQLGIFTANIKYIKIETGLENIEEILKTLYPKVLYLPQFSFILIKNFIRYQNLGGAKFEKSIYQKFLEQPRQIQSVLFRESEGLREIIERFNPELSQELSPTSENSDTLLMGYPEIEKNTDTLSIGYPTDTETDTETDTVSESKTVTVTEKIETNIGNNTSTNVDELKAQTEKKQNPPKRQKSVKPKKYSPEVVNFVNEFKAYRENFLKIPITQRDWHLRAYAVVNKLLQKYSQTELHEALVDLQTEYWSDKASKVIEIWHFEDWLPRWKIWKYPPTQSSLGSFQDNKYRRLYYEVYGRYPEES